MLVLTALSVSRRWKRIIDPELNHLQRAAWRRPDSPGNLHRHDYRIFSFAYAFGHGQTRGPIVSCRMPACWRKKNHSWPHLCSRKGGATYGEGQKCGEACTRLSTFLYSERNATAGSTLEARTAGRAEAITAAARIKTEDTNNGSAPGSLSSAKMSSAG